MEAMAVIGGDGFSLLLHYWRLPSNPLWVRGYLIVGSNSRYFTYVCFHRFLSGGDCGSGISGHLTARILRPLAQINTTKQTRRMGSNGQLPLVVKRAPAAPPQPASRPSAIHTRLKLYWSLPIYIGLKLFRALERLLLLSCLCSGNAPSGPDLITRLSPCRPPPMTRAASSR